MLQTTTVFHNVGKGIVAKDKELMEAFGTTENKAICLEILSRGEMQVGGRCCRGMWWPTGRRAHLFGMVNRCSRADEAVGRQEAACT